jgi:Fungalysin/Thermolysin Propeptide Motif
METTKRMLRKASIFIAMAFAGQFLTAQSLPQLNGCQRNDPQGFFFFEENVIPMEAMFTTFRDSMLKSPLESVMISKMWTDDILNMDHIRYQQYYDNAKVEGAELSEHGRNGFLVFSNGKLAHNFPHD